LPTLFDYYEAYEKPFTGETYRSLRMGPVPVYFNGIIQELTKEKNAISRS